MNAAPPTAAPSRPLLAGLALALAITAAYVTSFRGVMVFDDLHAIVDNPTIRDLGRPGQVLAAPAEGGTIGGRPLVNLTLALNYAAGGLEPRGYHAVNLAIHVLASLTLFGLVRRTLLRLDRHSDVGRALSPTSPDSTGLSPGLLAFSISALWALHPLQTESVTYIVQRAESLAGLWLLLTLYCFVRSLGSARPWWWQVAGLAACLAGMATKEVMAAAPLLVLLYDRTFIAGSWREAWRLRGRFHLALLATWLVLAGLIISAASRGGSAGFGTAVSSWDYALTQATAIPHYLRLALWPHPLVFDYGTPLVRSLAVAALPAALVLGLLAATVWSLVRRPALGFLGAWFFLLLAPSSSLVPVATQTMAEHRMYLPLAAVVALLAMALESWGGRRTGLVLLVLATVAGVLTARRNLVYHSELALWSDTVAHRPDNPRARTNLGIALAEAGRLEEAAAQFEASLLLQPANAATRLNLCDVLTRLGRAEQAVPHGEAAVRLEPGSANAHVNFAAALVRAGRPADAITHLEEAWRLQPEAGDIPARLATLQLDLGNRAAAAGDFDTAVVRYQRALAADAENLPARNNLANALLVSGHLDKAIQKYREILQRKPDDRRVQENLARALEMQANRR